MKTRGIAAGLALLLGAVLMTGCRAGETTITYDNGDAYTAGGTSLAKAIDSVEIHWSAGSVLVMSGQYETISFSEDGQDTEGKMALRYLVDGNRLVIWPCASGTAVSQDDDKDLVVTVPGYESLTGLSIDAGNAMVEVDDVDTAQLSVSNLTGTIRVETASPNVGMDLTSVHGDVIAALSALPAKLSISDTSGNVSLQIPEDSDATFDYTTTSGRFTSGMASEQNGTLYTIGDGGTQYEVDTVSGDLTVVWQEDSEQ
ncbi:MAG TPA: hypothetical protein DGX96_09145 [Lachnospiraceae bacterium]|nr:hypothetical protein [Lachnospiraceae bacterium]